MCSKPACSVVGCGFYYFFHCVSIATFVLQKQNPGVLSPGVLVRVSSVVDLLCVSSDPWGSLWCAIITDHLGTGPCGGSKAQAHGL